MSAPTPVLKTMSVIVTEKGGAQQRLDFDKLEVTIGRVHGNDIVLPKGNVSKRHARVVCKNGRFITVDLKSTNGTYVNGRKISSPLVVRPGDKIYIGDYILTLDASLVPQSAPVLAPVPPSAEAVPEPPPLSVAPVPPPLPPLPPPPRAEPVPPPAEADAAPDLERSAERPTSSEREETVPPPRPNPPIRAAIELWDRLVVSAVAAGHGADEAVAIADEVLRLRSLRRCE